MSKRKRRVSRMSCPNVELSGQTLVFTDMRNGVTVVLNIDLGDDSLRRPQPVRVVRLFDLHERNDPEPPEHGNVRVSQGCCSSRAGGEVMEADHAGCVPKSWYFDVADAICAESTGPSDLVQKARALRASLEYAKAYAADGVIKCENLRARLAEVERERDENQTMLTEALARGIAAQADNARLEVRAVSAEAHLCQAVGRMELDALEINHKDHACADCGAEKPHEGFYCIRHKAARYLDSLGLYDEDDLLPNGVETPLAALSVPDADGALKAHDDEIVERCAKWMDHHWPNSRFDRDDDLTFGGALRKYGPEYQPGVHRELKEKSNG